jgi:hypothetical protein
MDILNFIEAWILSLRVFLESSGVTVRFERTTDERPKASCVVNLRRDAVEADLIVWESGEADLTTMDRQGKVDQQHFEDVSGAGDLATLLARVLNAVDSR